MSVINICCLTARNYKKLFDIKLHLPVTVVQNALFTESPLNIITDSLPRHFSISKSVLSSKPEKGKEVRITVNQDGTIKKKKSHNTPKITLLKENSRVSMYLDEAEKIAKHSHLKLVEVGFEHDKKVYKLIKASDLLENEEEKSPKKGRPAKLKTIIIKAGLTDHDLGYKVNNVNKALEKGWNIRVNIEKHNQKSDKLEELFSKIEKLISPQHKMSKVSKRGSGWLFFINPGEIKKDEKEVSDSDESNEDKQNVIEDKEKREIKAEEC